MNMNYPLRGSEFGFEDERLKGQKVTNAIEKEDKTETKKNARILAEPGL